MIALMLTSTEVKTGCGLPFPAGAGRTRPKSLTLLLLEGLVCEAPSVDKPTRYAMPSYSYKA